MKFITGIAFVSLGILGQQAQAVDGCIPGDGYCFGSSDVDHITPPPGAGQWVITGYDNQDVKGDHVRDYLTGADTSQNLIIGGGGGDILTSGTGKGASNVFLYQLISDSTPAEPDTIKQFNPDTDSFTFGPVCKAKLGNTNKCHFIGTDPFSGNPGEVNYHQEQDPNNDGKMMTVIMANIKGGPNPDMQINIEGKWDLQEHNVWFGFPPNHWAGDAYARAKRMRAR